jgi:hypothetical protein
MRISTAVESQNKILAQDDSLVTELVEYQHSNLDALDDLREGHRLHTAAIGELRSILKPGSAHALSSALDPEAGRGYRSEMERSGPSRGCYAPFAFSIGNRFCMALLYGRAGRLTAENGGFRPRRAGWRR